MSSFTSEQISLAKQNRLYKSLYRNALDFYDMLSEAKRKEMSAEEYAEKEAVSEVYRLQEISKRPAPNAIDITTGKVIGKFTY